MEDKGRSFEPVNIGMSAIEIGRERFAKSGPGQTPRPAHWRLNLTALSQQYNLYFVAIEAYIHVYEPRFPYQKLGDAPEIVFQPRLANEHAPGYINPRSPHSINNLVIGQLGEEEILLLSTDNGNITGYVTRAFHNLARSNDVCAENMSNYSIRPFFTQWVVESAWGISIHREARMIAVSANASPRHLSDLAGAGGHRGSITVFAFALTTGDFVNDAGINTEAHLDTSEVDQEWHTWYPDITFATSSPNRTKNYKVVLAGSLGHPTNIPNISFLNTREDQQGTWLLSTDVDENVKLWQIWTGLCARTWVLRNDTTQSGAWMGMEERGWIAVALDKQAFQPVTGIESFIGHGRAPKYYGYQARGDSFDLTNIVRYHVPSNSWLHPEYASDDDDDGGEEEGNAHTTMAETRVEVAEDLSDCDSSGDEIETGHVDEIRTQMRPSLPYLRPTAEALRTTIMDMDVDAGMTYPSPDFEYISESSSDDEDNFIVRSDFSEGYVSDNDLPNESATSHRSDNSLPSTVNSEGLGYSVQHPGSAAIQMVSQNGYLDRSSRFSPTHPIASEDTREAIRTLSIPDVPFLYCSTSHLRLFNSVRTPTAHLFCARFLKQSVSTVMEDQGIFQVDRLDMVEQIPELGIVIIATQVGRCAICSLTKRRSDNLLGMRVDWVLPTSKQERTGQRPIATLHGIAVSPIQGRHPDVSTAHPLPKGKPWARDRIVDGISTMFDQTTLEISDPDERLMDDSGISTEHRLTATSPRAQEDESLNVKQFNWERAPTSIPWHAVDGTGRYRLMMTYSDMTVLTYEISRGVEREDIKDMKNISKATV